MAKYCNVFETFSLKAYIISSLQPPPISGFVFASKCVSFTVYLSARACIVCLSDVSFAGRSYCLGSIHRWYSHRHSSIWFNLTAFNFLFLLLLLLFEFVSSLKRTYSPLLTFLDRDKEKE